MNKYDRKLDRLITHNSVTSNYSNGFHDFIMDEIELGARVALELDDENQTWWNLVQWKQNNKKDNSSGS